MRNEYFLGGAAEIFSKSKMLNIGERMMFLKDSPGENGSRGNSNKTRIETIQDICVQPVHTYLFTQLSIITKTDPLFIMSCSPPVFVLCHALCVRLSCITLSFPLSFL